MRTSEAVDLWIADFKSEGRIRSPHTEQAYREAMGVLIGQINDRDPSKIGKADIKRVLAKWENPNSRRQKHAIYRSFFRWCVWEDIRKTNPAEEVRPTRAKKTQATRLTAAEAVRFMEAAQSVRRDRWVAVLMLCGGLRNTEMRALRGRAFLREGFVIVDEGVKRDKPRVVPVTVEMQPVVDEILTLVAPDDYVIPGRVRSNPPAGEQMRDKPQQMLSSPALIKQVGRIAKRAGIGVHVTPHTLRHTYGEHTARWAGLRAAQGLLGHESVSTTADIYTAGASAEELRTSMSGFAYASPVLSTDSEAESADVSARFT